MNITEDLYRRWLRAAFLYYLSPGDDTGMSDYEWDAVSREMYKNRDRHPEWTPIHHPDFEGGSLFFLLRDEYPDWARTA